MKSPFAFVFWFLALLCSFAGCNAIEAGGWHLFWVLAVWRFAKLGAKLWGEKR